MALLTTLKCFQILSLYVYVHCLGSWLSRILRAVSVQQSRFSQRSRTARRVRTQFPQLHEINTDHGCYVCVWPWSLKSVGKVARNEGRYKIGRVRTSWNLQAWAGTQESGLKLLLVLAVSDLDNVGILQENLVSFILELNTHLAQEKLKEGGSRGNGVIAGLAAALYQRA